MAAGPSRPFVPLAAGACALACAVLAILAGCSPLTPAQAERRVTQVGVTTTTQQAAEGEGRVAAVPAQSPSYDHLEGIAFRNACGDDRECHAAGCSSEVCSADEGVATACVVYPDKPTGASCGCVKGQCLWYRSGAGAAAATAAAGEAAAKRPPPAHPDAGAKTAAAAEQGQPCPGGACAPGLECVTYFGIAGPRGGAMTSCEIRCAGGHACPRGQSCVTIADGPGQVCRPDPRP